MVRPESGADVPSPPHEPSPAPPPAEERPGAWVERALIAVGVLLLFFSAKHQVVGDGLVRYQALRLLFEQGEIPDVPYSMIGPMVASPFYWLDRYVGPPLWWSGRFNFFVSAIGLWVLHRLLRPYLSAAVLRKFVLLLVGASMFGRHQMDFYAEVLSSMLAGAGLLALAFGSSAWAWAALVIAAANVPATLGGLGLAAVGVTILHRRWRYLVLPVAAGAVVLVESWVRRGDPFDSGYGGNAGLETVLPYSGLPGFSYPLVFGLLSIFFSFGKGLVFFTPGLFLPVRERLTGRSSSLWKGYLLWILFVVGLVLVYARWWSWYGGWYWGPRFFLFACLPAALALAVVLEDRPRGALLGIGTLVALTLSVLGSATGVVFDQSGLEMCMLNGMALESMCWYVPELSPLFHPFVTARALSLEDVLFLTFHAVTFAWLAGPLVRDLVAGAVTVLKHATTRVGPQMRF